MYWLKKLAGMLATLFLVSILTFVALYLIPGDPALLIMGTEADPQVLDLVRDQLGLNQPKVLQYINWLGGILHGDFGQSLTFSRGYPVAKLIAASLPITIPLALTAVILSLAVAIPLGALAASRQGSLLDTVILYVSQAGLSIPAFWLGILGIQFFSVKLGWFPPGSISRWSTNPGEAALALVLPALILALPRATILTRIVRTTMLETLRKDYIRAARGRGVREKVLIFSHALANALVSIGTVAGIQLIQLLAGTVVVEQVFSLPGLGRLILSAVLLRDLPLVQGAIFSGAAMILLFNFLMDSLYPFLDPRIRGRQ